MLFIVDMWRTAYFCRKSSLVKSRMFVFTHHPVSCFNCQGTWRRLLHRHSCLGSDAADGGWLKMQDWKTP